MEIKLSLLDLPLQDLRASVDEDALDELAASLRDVGQLQSIGVKEKADGRFEVVFGARRTRAANLLGWDSIRGELVTDSERLPAEAAKLVENVVREDLTPMEEAYGLLGLIGDGIPDIRQLERQTGKNRSWIKGRLALIEMPEDLQGALQAGVIALGVAQAFATIESTEVREMYLKDAILNGCTTDQAKMWASQAQYAASGIATMDKLRELGDHSTTSEPPVDMQYHCFICADVYSWRRTNTLVVCNGCQDSISAARTPHSAPPVEYPLDNGAILE